MTDKEKSQLAKWLRDDLLPSEGYQALIRYLRENKINPGIDAIMSCEEEKTLNRGRIRGLMDALDIPTDLIEQFGTVKET